MNEAAIERNIRRGRIHFLVAVGLFAVGLRITGVMILPLIVFARAFRAYRTEPGLWMLALLVCFVYSGAWAVFQLDHVRDLFEPAPAGIAAAPPAWHRLWRTLDGTLALVLLGETGRLTCSMAAVNWRLTKPPGMGPRRSRPTRVDPNG